MGEAFHDPAKEAFTKEQREKRLAAEEKRRGATNPNYRAYLEKKRKGELGKEPPIIH